MKNLCVFLLLLAAVTLQVNGSVRINKRQANKSEITKVPEDNETVDDIINENEEEDSLGEDRFNRPSGGGWQKGKGGACNGGNKRCPDINGVTSKPKPEPTSRPEPSPKPQPTPRPEPTPKPKPDHDGSMVFPDSNEDDYWKPRPKPTLRPVPTPQPTAEPTPKPEPTPTKPPTPTLIPTPTPTLTPTPNPDELEKEKDPEITPTLNECLESCTMTAEDYPVCGSDGKTYINLDHFICAKTCKVDVTILSQGPCAKSPTDCPPKPSPPTPETINQCIRGCPMSNENNPVCGTDGVTYTNVAGLLCAKLCGKSVNLDSKSSCYDKEPVTTLPIDKDKEPESTTLSPVIRQCIRTCRVTSEFNPVCGTNGVTYSNIGRLQCAKNCGVMVDMLSEGPCHVTPATKRPLRNTTPSLVARACLIRCPKTDDYNPVCGTDYVTYANPTFLYCAQYCGSDVTLLSRGPCFATPTTPEVTESTLSPFKDPTSATTQSSSVRACIRNCPTTPEYNPVCGTNYVTYDNSGHLFCARSCGVVVDTMRPGKCPQRTPGTTIATTEVTTLLTPTIIGPKPNTPKPAETSTTRSIIVRDCIASCGATPEYNPVCGTDGFTYNNLAQLNCAQMCGVDVKFSRQGPCPDKVLAGVRG